MHVLLLLWSTEFVVIVASSFFVSLIVVVCYTEFLVSFFYEIVLVLCNCAYSSFYCDVMRCDVKYGTGMASMARIWHKYGTTYLTICMVRRKADFNQMPTFDPFPRGIFEGDDFFAIFVIWICNFFLTFLVRF